MTAGKLQSKSRTKGGVSDVCFRVFGFFVWLLVWFFLKHQKKNMKQAQQDADTFPSLRKYTFPNS